MKISSCFSTFKEKIVEIINDFKDRPLFYIEEILTYLSVAVAAVAFLASYIIFIVGGGYSREFSIIKNKGVGAITEAFTYGNTSILTFGVLSLILKILLALLFILLLVDFFRDNVKSKRIVMAINLPFLIICGTITGLIIYFGTANLDLDEKTQLKLMPYLYGEYSNTVKIAAIVITALFLISLIVFIVLLAKTKPLRMVKNIIFSGACNLILLPLLLLLLENAVPLFALVILVIVIFFVGVFILSNNTSSSPENSGELEASGNHISEERGHVNWYLENGTRVYVKEAFIGGPRLYAFKENFTNTKYEREVPYPMSSMTRPTLEDFKQGRISIFIGNTQIFPKDLYYKKGI